MAKIYEHLLSTNIPQEQKGGTRSTPKIKICWARIVYTANDSFFFITWLNCIGCFRGEIVFCVLSSVHENQNVATIGTLLDQFMISCI